MVNPAGLLQQMQISIREVNHTADLNSGGSWRQGAGLLEKMIQCDRETSEEPV
jgi:hypothetical protein